jgi:hypothetical protein
MEVMLADDDLRATVEAQAAAHVAGDAARFASYMTPGALVELGRSADVARGIVPKRYQVFDVTVAEDDGTSDVRYDGRGSYVIHAAWQRTSGGWKATSAERPRQSIRQPWWRRWLPGGRVEAPPERQELS